MWSKVARRLVHARWGILAVWVLAALISWTLAPDLTQVSLTNEMAFLPDNAPSQQAAQLFAERFPSEADTGEGMLVFFRPGGLTETHLKYAAELASWLSSDEAPEGIGTVTSPPTTLAEPSVLLSEDGTTLVLPFDLTVPPLSDAANYVVDTVRQHVEATKPNDLDVYLTGQAAIERDLMAAIIEGIDRTTAATIVLVVLILLFIYRAPVAAGIPLFSIGVAFLVARGVLAWLAQHGLAVSSDTEAFLVVLIFGVGTDYTLFLISRFREELSRQHELAVADVETLTRVGPVIAASGAVVVLGLLAMLVAQFEMIKTRGPALALGVLVALLASLTLTPALLSLLGHRLFWPFHRSEDHGAAQRSRMWEQIATAVANRPLLAAIMISLVLVVPYAALPHMERQFDILAEIPADREARRGFEVVREHFGASEVLPTVVLVEAPVEWTSAEGLRHVARLHTALADHPGVSRVRSLVDPLGEGESPLAVRQQLRTVADELEKTSAVTADQPADDLAYRLSEAGRQLDTLRQYFKALGDASPDVRETPAYRAVMARLDEGAAQIESWRSSLSVAYQVGLIEERVRAWGETPVPALLAEGNVSAVQRQIAGLRAYFEALGAAHPALASEEAFRQAVEALNTIETTLAEMAASFQLSAQMNMLAETFAAPPPSLSPDTLAQTAGETETLIAYLEAVGETYPDVRAEPAYNDALSRLQGMLTALRAIQQGTLVPGPETARQLLADRQALSADFQALSDFFAPQDAPFVSEILLASPEAQRRLQALEEARHDLQRALAELRRLPETEELLFVPPAPVRNLLDTGSEPPFDPAATAKALAAAIRALADVVPPDAYFWPTGLGPAAINDLDRLQSAFVGRDGRTLRFQVALAIDPYSTEAREVIGDLERELAAYVDPLGGHVYIGGTTAQSRDVWTFMDRDLRRVTPAVIASVWGVLVLLLGSLVAPVYLVATVVLSYGTTLGLMTWIFQDVLGHGGVNHTIPLVLLVLLVALGADYNIFLVSRIWEESERALTLREGVRVASAYTGRVITSAGIILAGTFAALMVSSMQSLFQIGAAVALGVLIDTFIVRGVLVPALVVLFGSLNWWPAPKPLGHGGIFRLLFARFQ